MEPRVKIVPVTMEHVEAMAPNVRAADKDEIWALMYMKPIEALQLAIHADGEHNAVFLDGEVVAIFGCVPGKDRSAAIWVIGTDAIYENADLFHKHTAEWLELYRERFDRLYNWVDARNTASLRWVESVGFTIQPAIPTGASQLPFHYIEWRRKG